MHVSDYALEKAQEAAAMGNFGQGPNFGLSSSSYPDDPDNWVVVNTSHRDSGLRERVNAEALEAIMAPFCKEPLTCGYCGEGILPETTVCPDCEQPCGADAATFGASHWGCGWTCGTPGSAWAMRAGSTLPTASGPPSSYLTTCAHGRTNRAGS